MVGTSFIHKLNVCFDRYEQMLKMLDDHDKALKGLEEEARSLRNEIRALKMRAGKIKE